MNNDIYVPRIDFQKGLQPADCHYYLLIYDYNRNLSISPSIKIWNEVQKCMRMTAVSSITHVINFSPFPYLFFSILLTLYDI